MPVLSPAATPPGRSSQLHDPLEQRVEQPMLAASAEVAKSSISARSGLALASARRRSRRLVLSRRSTPPIPAQAERVVDAARELRDLRGQPLGKIPRRAGGRRRLALVLAGPISPCGCDTRHHLRQRARIEFPQRKVVSRSSPSTPTYNSRPSTYLSTRASELLARG